MRILMLTPSLPYPPHQGGALRNFGLIQGLHQAGHRISLLSFASTNDVPENTPLQTFCERLVTVPAPVRSVRQRIFDLVSTPAPYLIRRLESDIFRQCLINLLHENRYDLVQFEGLEMAGYLNDVRQHQPSAQLCYDAHNAEYQLQQVIFKIDRSDPRRWLAAAYSFIQTQRIRRTERRVCQTANLVLAVSEEDAEALRPFRDDHQITVIPNGIFTESYQHPTEALDLGNHAIVFTGKMDYRPNVDAMLWFSADILPRILSRVPDAHLYIVGQKPHVRLQILQTSHHITITGWVADVVPYLHAAAVYIAPLRMGSGTRLKILEAMAAGCAIVATPLAAAGLPESLRSSLVMTEHPHALADAVIQLLNDADKRHQMGASAHAAVQQHFDWSTIIPRLLNAYREIGLG
jgi:glycosyltransferase involved in cell wall biosynthesis